MEPVISDESPLAHYLKDGVATDESEPDWTPALDSSPVRPPSQPSLPSSSSSPLLPPSPSPFAPTGRPRVSARFRGKSLASSSSANSPSARLRSIKKRCSAAVTASIDRADNAKFLEQFRYTIIASQLLSGHSLLVPRSTGQPLPTLAYSDNPLLSTEGIIASVLGALAVAVILSWLRNSVQWHMSRKRMAFLFLVLAVTAFLGQIYMRRQWLRYRREQALCEMATFVSNSHDFDSAIEATLSLVQEVELVSRGYRISAPLPPVSRLEDRSQNRKCQRLRQALKTSFAQVLPSYIQASRAIKVYAEQTELEKYYDIYDITDFDISDALQGFNETELDDAESLRALKVLAARFHTNRKMLLCALLALDSNTSRGAAELQRWTTAVEALRNLNTCTKSSYDKIGGILSEQQTFPLPPSPKGPLTPGRERWRSQLRKLNSLSTGIRGLQAKLHLLREESDRALDDSNDLSEIGPSLMSQYDSIGSDLKELMAAWEDGKAALALGIDRNEKRLSSMSTVLSSMSSLSALSTQGEGNAAEAFKALTGESPPALSPARPEAPEVFEAMALPRPRSLLTREERIIKVREEREQKAMARQQLDATKGMLRELETVISRRPKSRTSAPVPGRIVSL
ncbi:hypothetical protein CDD81_5589 [Ophiocordyceps australis]|uniref:Vezatin n=1 Tax=Ophiocordyceps australis TaxID=1399860 RepID=A0A2C5Y4T8_9HYPO|nr:hypothetical protein CDD81_5589 [Ophiocordyceps australis]